MVVCFATVAFVDDVEFDVECTVGAEEGFEFAFVVILTVEFPFGLADVDRNAVTVVETSAVVVVVATSVVVVVVAAAFVDAA